jgi:hypothetical protein
MNRTKSGIASEKVWIDPEKADILKMELTQKQTDGLESSTLSRRYIQRA